MYPVMGAPPSSLGGVHSSSTKSLSQLRGSGRPGLPGSSVNSYQVLMIFFRFKCLSKMRYGRGTKDDISFLKRSYLTTSNNSAFFKGGKSSNNFFRQRCVFTMWVMLPAVWSSVPEHPQSPKGRQSTSNSKDFAGVHVWHRLLTIRWSVSSVAEVEVEVVVSQIKTKYSTHRRDS